jgi:hypothetical protein
MELEQVVMVVLLLVIVYMLLQMRQPQQQHSDNMVYLRSPYMGPSFRSGPMWRGRGRRWGRRGGRGRRF